MAGDFWDLSDGESAATSATKEFEMPGGGNFDPIPDGSTVLAMIDEAKWDAKADGAEYISLRWTVIAPEAFKNRKVFQKLWVTDDDPSADNQDKAAKKRDKARRMLAAIDANAGGKLTKKAGVPSNEDLTINLSNKPMTIKCMVWTVQDSKTGDEITGNWISAVAPKSKGTNVTDAGRAAPSKNSSPMAKAKERSFADTAEERDEIPF